jgi:hypothetical protein
MCSNDRRRLGMPSLAVILAVLTAVSMLAAQKPTIAPDQNHVVLVAYNRSALQAALDRASSAGLHVLFGNYEGVFLSRVQVPDPPGAYRAIRENSTDRLEQALNEVGEQSFRLIPATLTRSQTGTVAVVRRAVGVVTHYRYRVVPSNDGLEKNIRDLASKGFSLVDVFTQQSGMAATVGRPGRLYAVLEASGGVSTSNTTTFPGSQYRMVSALRASTVERELNQKAGEGYEVVGGSFMNVLLEKLAGNSPEHSYRVIGAIRGTTLQNEIDEAGRAGFRVVRAAIMSNPNSKAETVVVMERMSSSVHRYQYQWVSASRLADSSLLDNLLTAGYAPIALWRSGFVPVDEFGNQSQVDADSYFVLLEKPT